MTINNITGALATTIDSTNERLKTTLVTPIAGEDITNNFLCVNDSGYKYCRTVKFTYSGAVDARVADSGVNAQVFEITNTSAVQVWVYFGAADQTPPAAGAFSTFNGVIIPATSSKTVKFYQASGTNQVCVEPAASATGDVIITAYGNS